MISNYVVQNIERYADASCYSRVEMIGSYLECLLSVMTDDKTTDLIKSNILKNIELILRSINAEHAVYAFEHISYLLSSYCLPDCNNFRQITKLKDEKNRITTVDYVFRILRMCLMSVDENNGVNITKRDESRFNDFLSMSIDVLINSDDETLKKYINENIFRTFDYILKHTKSRWMYDLYFCYFDVLSNKLRSFGVNDEKRNEIINLMTSFVAHEIKEHSSEPALLNCSIRGYFEEFSKIAQDKILSNDVKLKMIESSYSILLEIKNLKRFSNGSKDKFFKEYIENILKFIEAKLNEIKYEDINEIIDRIYEVCRSDLHRKQSDAATIGLQTLMKIARSATTTIVLKEKIATTMFKVCYHASKNEQQNVVDTGLEMFLRFRAISSEKNIDEIYNRCYYALEKNYDEIAIAGLRVLIKATFGENENTKEIAANKVFCLFKHALELGKTGMIIERLIGSNKKLPNEVVILFQCVSKFGKYEEMKKIHDDIKGNLGKIKIGRDILNSFELEVQKHQPKLQQTQQTEIDFASIELSTQLAQATDTIDPATTTFVKEDGHIR